MECCWRGRTWVKKKEKERNKNPSVCTGAKQLNVPLIYVNGKKGEVEPSRASAQDPILPAWHCSPHTPWVEAEGAGLCALRSFPSLIYMVIRALLPEGRASAKSKVLTITKLTSAVISPKC